MVKFNYPTFKMLLNSDPGQPAVGSITINDEKIFTRLTHGEQFTLYPVRQYTAYGAELIGIDICAIPVEEVLRTIPDWDAEEMVDRFMRMCDKS